MLKPDLLVDCPDGKFRQADMTAAEGSNGRIVWVVGWALATAILVVGYGAAALQQQFVEPDNAMRLVRIRDMLAGQGWFDNVQHRLNPPDGTPMHWAQWIDAAIAGPLFLLKLFVGQRVAEVIMAFVWPLGLLAVFMMLVVRISGEIGATEGLRREAEWAGAILAALAFPVTDKFSPGSFDHHNVELILALVAVLSIMKMRRSPSLGAWAGAAMGVAIATAAEAVPLVAAGLIVGGLLWLVHPSQFARGLGWIGAGLAAASIVMFFALVSPAQWGRPVCDAMGAPFLGFGLVGGVIAIALARAPSALTATLLRRVGVGGLLGAFGIVVLLVLFPECAGGGYSALGADMETLWMSQISETRSLSALASDNPTMILSVAGAAFAGLIAAVLYLRQRWREAEGWVVFAFLIAGWAVLAWQIRGATFATTFAIPFGAWAVSRARRIYRRRASVIGALVLAGVAASSAAAAWASAGAALQARVTPRDVMNSYQTRSAGAKACFTPAAFQSLGRAEPGVMLNQFSLGAGVLQWTSHSVLAGPYHRDVNGTMTMIQALRSAPDVARPVVAGSPADYVLVCPAAPETSFYALHAGDGAAPDATLSAMLARGEHPDWLTPVDIGASTLKLYRIKR